MKTSTLAWAAALVLVFSAARGAEDDRSVAADAPSITIGRMSLSLKSWAHSSEEEFESALARSKAVVDSEERMAAVLAGETSLYAASKLRGQERLDYLERMARDGDAAAASALGDMLDTGDGVETDATRAFGYYHAAALGGRMEAAHNFGAAYAKGRGVQRDFAAALAWLIVARERGDESGEDERLRGFLLGRGRDATVAAAEAQAFASRTKRSREEVLAVLPPVAELIFRPELTAAENLAVFEDHVERTNPLSPETPPVVVMTILGKRLVWPGLADLERAANRGDAPAMGAKGRLLASGRLLPLDPLGAVVWLERAAALGDVDAAHQLGDLYSKGGEIVRDDAKAFAYFLQAAQGGSSVAMVNVGVYFTNGRGTQKDLVKGLAWLIVAKQLGVNVGQEARLRGFLTQHRPGDVVKAESLAAELKQEIRVTDR